MEQFGLIQDLAVVLGIGGLVAWLCQRLGLSVIVGYLTAGILIGPFTPPFSLVTSVENVQTLSNLGLIFVLFFVGLNLSVPRLRKMGTTTAVSTVLTALMLLVCSRVLGQALHFTVTQSLFLAGTVMTSSSAIISAVLREQDATRQPFAQQALGQTVLEDVVAVVMLAVLGSVGAAAAGAAAPSAILARLAGFVLVLLVGGLLVVPRLLARLRGSASPDIQTICTAGLLLGLAWLAARAGYSLALGAFLLGSIIGGTPYRARLEQAFEGLRDLFAAVFFVSMGMLFDVHLAVSAWPLVLGLSAFGLIGRALAAATSLSLIGQPAGFAVQSALSLLPLGEFSFVIAQLGVSSGLMPPVFYSATVGAALVTTLLGPSLMRFSGTIAGAVERHEPELLLAWRDALRRSAGAIRERREGNPLGRILPGRLVQLTVEVGLVASALMFSRAIYDSLAASISPGSPLMTWFPVVYWVVFGLVLLLPLVAIWRNLGALSMILAEAATRGVQHRARLQPLLERGLQASGALGVLVICLAFLPQRALRLDFLGPLLLVGAGLALLLRSRLVRWYSRMHAEIRDRVAQERPEPVRAPALATGAVRWNLRVHEHVLSDLSPAVGRTLRELELRSRFGCAIAGIDRQGLVVANPGGDVVLAPNDQLLLVGTEGQIDAAEEWLRREERVTTQGFADLVTQDVVVPAGSGAAGRTLAELAVASRFGVQILAVGHDGRVVAAPSGEAQLNSGDSLLVLGTPAQHGAFAAWLAAGASVREG